MQNRFTLVFGGVIAFILLLLYASTLVYMIVRIVRLTGDSPLVFSEGVQYVVTTVGGLVSALVISKLTITEPGENPTFFNMAGADDGQPSKVVTWLAFLYLAVWILTGLAALVVGVMFFPDASDTVSDIGTTWLGLAVAAGYAYFNIKPK